MIAIDDKLISDDIVQREFVCNLSACKGACCVKGEGGAPLEERELSILDDIYETIKDYLLPEGREVIEREGKYTIHDSAETDNRLVEHSSGFVTPLVDGGQCAYLGFDEQGIAKCQIERAWEDGLIDFQKPISCHLYPIRYKTYEHYEALNYSRWEICDPACALGKELQVPIYKFLREPLIRRYGQRFYDELEAAAKAMEEEKPID